jgi:hypothetical protein
LARGDSHHPSHTAASDGAAGAGFEVHARGRASSEQLRCAGRSGRYGPDAMGGLGAPEVLIILGVLVPYVVIIWGIADAASRPDTAWAAARQNKALWITMQAVGLLFCAGGMIVSLVYFAAVRPRLSPPDPT